MSLKVVCTVVNRKGLHTRAAAEIVKISNQFDATVNFEYAGKVVPSNNMIQLLTLAASCDEQVTISASGAEAEQAVEALKSCFAMGFYPEADCKPS